MWKQSFGIPKYNLADSVLFSQRMKSATEYVTWELSWTSMTSFPRLPLSFVWEFSEESLHTALSLWVPQTGGKGKSGCSVPPSVLGVPPESGQSLTFFRLRMPFARCAMPLAACLLSPFPLLKTNFNVEGLRALWCFKPIINYLTENHRLFI